MPYFSCWIRLSHQWRFAQIKSNANLYSAVYRKRIRGAVCIRLRIKLIRRSFIIPTCWSIRRANPMDYAFCLSMYIYPSSISILLMIRTLAKGASLAAHQTACTIQAVYVGLPLFVWSGIILSLRIRRPVVPSQATELVWGRHSSCFMVRRRTRCRRELCK